MSEIKSIGADWLALATEGLTETIERVSPSQFNEATRYLPESVTSMPGFIRYDVNPFMREIVDCFDVDSGVREVNLKKGVQITYTTLLESGLLYYMAHVKTLPCMYMTADKELAAARVENNILPMIHQSGLSDIIQSSDVSNSRKTGNTKHHIQWAGGGYLVPFGAKNADKMRSYSIAVLLKDEIDAWPNVVGKDGDPDALSDDRCAGYWERRKIFRGSTPLLKGSSKIEKAYQRGDKRKYHVLCKNCNFPQELRWSYGELEKGGFRWELEDGVLLPESVRYQCRECDHPHYEHDKERLFSEAHGAKWIPTGRPVERGIRSYHLPALYSPIGMQPWYKSVGAFLAAFDTEERKVRDIAKYQVFYNNVLAEPFEVMGFKVQFTAVSLHRRAVYRLGQVPNVYAKTYSGGPVLLVTCQVDVHKSFLAVAVVGWCKDARHYVLDYFRLEDEDCSEPSSKVWSELRAFIEEKRYVSDDGRTYKISLTLIDSGYANDVVIQFCSQYVGGVFPILGRERLPKSTRVREFAPFETMSGVVGYSIVVDHYKDRLAPVLRREWTEDSGLQKPYHFNAPVDLPDAALKELTAETRRERIDSNGNKSYYWHRSGNARNELWDLLVYGHAGIDIIAWYTCVNHFKLKTIDWDEFWRYLENEEVYFEFHRD